MTEIRYGTVSVVDYKEGRVKVVFDDLGTSSADLIVFQLRNKGTKYYSMPEIGEKGLCLIAETGRSGYYLGSGYCLPEPIMEGAEEGKTITLYPDGTRIEYDQKSSKLFIDCKKDIEIICPTITITGDIKLLGNIDITSGDVTADGISLKNHKTSGVKAGSDTSGKPVT
ncbi:phage baseplate assembly protein V [Fusobacterium varium]|uniref:phage baseplate assembly protein V n=1 Tax=Fusobacterium varium TaxID=856 RepID=UPI0032C0DB6D